MDSNSQWSLQQQSYRRVNSDSSSLHKYQQWSSWDYPVYYSPPRSYPLVSDDQRNVHSYCYHSDTQSPYLQDPVLLEHLEQPQNVGDPYVCPEQGSLSAQGTWPQSHFEDATSAHEPMAARSVEITFPNSFFINPFAVSFPGDIPCPSTTAMSVPWMDCMPPSARLDDANVSLGDRSMHVAEMAPSGPSATMLSVSLAAQLDQPGGNPIPTAPPVEATPPKIKQPTTKYGQGIHFVDMTNKKESQRIRNTMNSRKHRQNKLDRIRELEKKLAASEAETQRLQAKAEEPRKQGLGNSGTI